MNAVAALPPPLTGAEVKALRIGLGFSVEQLAVALGVTSTTIYNWQRRGADPVTGLALLNVAAEVAKTAKTATKTLSPCPSNKSTDTEF
jgi:DNA-binding transcriptional regulator YiaG